MRETRRRNAVLLSAWRSRCGRARPVLAQAWLPPKGEASFSVGGQYLGARYHLFSEGRARRPRPHAVVAR